MNGEETEAVWSGIPKGRFRFAGNAYRNNEPRRHSGHRYRAKFPLPRRRSFDIISRKPTERCRCKHHRIQMFILKFQINSAGGAATGGDLNRLKAMGVLDDIVNKVPKNNQVYAHRKIWPPKRLPFPSVGPTSIPQPFNGLMSV